MQRCKVFIGSLEQGGKNLYILEDEVNKFIRSGNIKVISCSHNISDKICSILLVYKEKK